MPGGRSARSLHRGGRLDDQGAVVHHSGRTRVKEGEVTPASVGTWRPQGGRSAWSLHCGSRRDNRGAIVHHRGRTHVKEGWVRVLGVDAGLRRRVETARRELGAIVAPWWPARRQRRSFPLVRALPLPSPVSSQRPRHSSRAGSRLVATTFVYLDARARRRAPRHFARLYRRPNS
ncbi:hypothetical protein BKA93DRAFT_795743 [Sparassis latifolia]